MPKTGQTHSYSAGDDGDLQKGVQWPEPRFTDNGDGTVKDNLTGLIWLKKADCFEQRRWSDALNDISNLAAGDCDLSDDSRAGDWRLPNLKELQSLTHYGVGGPAVPNTAGNAKWTEGDPFFDAPTQDDIDDIHWTSTSADLWKYRQWPDPCGVTRPFEQDSRGPNSSRDVITDPQPTQPVPNTYMIYIMVYAVTMWDGGVHRIAAEVEHEGGTRA